MVMTKPMEKKMTMMELICKFAQSSMIRYDLIYSLSSVQYYIFCRAGDEDEDDGAADGYVDIVFTLSFV